MWQPQGDKLASADRLGTLQPVTVLCENPKLFTCTDNNDDLQLAFQCGEEAGVKRYVIVPIDDGTVEQVKSGALGVREALKQARTFLADVDAGGKVTAAWKTDLAKIPDTALPKPGTKASALTAAALAPAPAAKPAAAPAAPAPAAGAKPAGPKRSGRINIERMTHRNSIMVPGEQAATYALLKLIPSGDTKGPPLNLALLCDISGSMFQEDGTGTSRLARVQEACKLAIGKLRPEDTLAIVGFAYNAKVLLPPTSIAEKDKIEDIIDRIDQFDIDGGGTAMDEGMRLAIDEVEKLSAPDRLSQIVILTDGETTGEMICRKIAEEADQKKIHLTLMGVGTEWNASLLKELAKTSQGKWYYIDVTQQADTERVILEEFAALASSGFLNVEMHVRPLKGITVRRVRQVAPDIKTFELETPEERHHVAKLGTLMRDNPTKYILDLTVPKRPDGKFSIAQIEISFDTGTGTRETITVPLELSYTSAGHGYINAEVAKHIDEVQVSELNESLQKAINANNTADVQKMAEALVKKGEVMGKAGAKKTMLAKQVLQEINVGGRVSKKTQLAMDDAARQAMEG